MSHTLDKLTKLELNKVMSARKGVALKFDKYLLSLDASESSILLYSGLFFLVPRPIRKSFHKHNHPVKMKKSKEEVYKTLGISRTQFYRSINELEKLGLVTTVATKYGVSYYNLNYNLDATTESSSEAFITTDMLQNKYVTTKQNKQKTFSANARIVLGKLTRLSQQRANRTVETTAKDLSSSFGLSKSTMYYLLKQFTETGLIEANKVEACIYTLVLLDHYVSKQRQHNQEVIDKRANFIKFLYKEPTRAESDAIDRIFNSIK
ncbi:hypothetical protein [Acholeplasma hippikon]|uniref:Predicted transcriptional regulator n=1 Tax=Acholeplasma hippikon TaxID=264636 RepID=A0A449BL35_9MOLU|nr:hypothetical protein [Acholeplasma hippikon]VEU83140.1 Predicted transcriptional regulator [Acholeplasma hippikon]VEU83349.1 Predicted transcriptional regulator [Acholeplasma hippikon]